MNQTALILARRYATAYLGRCDAELSSQDIDLIAHAQQFFTEHRQALYFLSIPTLKRKQKLNIMLEVFRKLALPLSCDPLMALLILHKRAMLWPEVLGAIIKLYQQKHQIMHMYIESAPEIDESKKAALQEFLADKTGNDIIYTYRVNPELIAGIRARSDTLLWEYSIAKKLRTIRLSLIQ